MEHGEPRVNFEELDESVRTVWQDMRALAVERYDEYYQSIEGDPVAEEVFTRQTLGELRDILSRHPNQTTPIDLDCISESLPPQEQLRRLVMRELDASKCLFENPELQQLQDYEVTSTLTYLIERFDNFGISSDEAAERARIVAVPEPFVVIDQGDEVIERERTAFFEAILQQLALSEAERQRDCQVVTSELVHPDKGRETDDRITMLIVSDRLAATVLERRTEFNYTEVAFASHVTPRLIDELLERRRILGE
jgi:hypothetical protein